jgi:hypothetical protein
LAPEFHIARFQLGFFTLSSGDAKAALTHWAPLLLLSEEHYLYHFVTGLTHLIRDEFDEAIQCLKIGIGSNQENLPLNKDMQRIIQKCTELVNNLNSSDVQSNDDEVVSSTSMLLGQFNTPNKKH